MPKRLLSSLTWKAGVAAAAFALAAGTGATTVSFVNSSSTDDTPAVTSTSTPTADKGADAKDDDTKDDDEKADDDSTVKAADATNATNDAAGAEHPDNFGAKVSVLARDGGAADDDISDMAHDKNDARKAEHDNEVEANEAGDDYGKGADHADDRADDKGDNGNHGDDGSDD